MRVDEALLLIKDQDLAVEIEALDDLAADIQKKMIENEKPDLILIELDLFWFL